LDDFYIYFGHAMREPIARHLESRSYSQITLVVI